MLLISSKEVRQGGGVGDSRKAEDRKIPVKEKNKQEISQKEKEGRKKERGVFGKFTATQKLKHEVAWRQAGIVA